MLSHHGFSMRTTAGSLVILVARPPNHYHKYDDANRIYLCVHGENCTKTAKTFDIFGEEITSSSYPSKIVIGVEEGYPVPTNAVYKSTVMKGDRTFHYYEVWEI